MGQEKSRADSFHTKSHGQLPSAQKHKKNTKSLLTSFEKAQNKNEKSKQPMPKGMGVTSIVVDIGDFAKQKELDKIHLKEAELKKAKQGEPTDLKEQIAKKLQKQIEKSVKKELMAGARHMSQPQLLSKSDKKAPTYLDPI